MNDNEKKVFEDLKKKLDIACSICNTVYGPNDRICPQCSSLQIKYVPKDVRQVFSVDNRQQGPI